MLDYPIDYVVWDTTWACNLHCPHCRAMAPKNVPLIEGERLEYLFDQLEELSVDLITLTGGEIFTRNDALDLAKKSVEHGLRTRIQTNGLLLTKEIVHSLKDFGICNIGTGLDGASDLTYNHLRQKNGAFNVLIHNIKMIKAEDIPMSIECVINPKNLSELEDTINLANSIGIDMFLARMAIPTSHDYPHELLVSPEDYRRALRLIAKKRNQLDRMLLNSQDPLYVIYDDELRIKIIEKYGDRLSSGNCIGGCTAGINMLYINPLGDIQPCPFLPVKAGNIFEQPLKEIWQSAKVFQLLRNRDNREGKCGACEYKHICGGCRARSMFLGSGLMGEDPFCLKTS